MAEYNMTYEEVQDFLNVCISRAENPEKLQEHRSELLAAITARNDGVDGGTSIKESLELWENQEGTPSELLLGTRYIVIKDSVLKFIEAAFASGFVDWAMENFQDPVKGMAVGTAAGMVSCLIQIFRSVVKLDDSEFCVYMQAVTHFHEYREFTVSDLQQWFPNGDKLTCNMHNSKWDCEHLTENDVCDMLCEKNLEEALKSLCEKSILNKERIGGDYKYKFKV